MRAAVLSGKRDLRLDKVSAPDCADGEVIVRTVVGSICGSDLHYYQHGQNGTIKLREPLVLGHEVAGIVEKVGSGVGELRPG